MQRWNAFLGSLATRGGAIFLLTMIFVIGMGISLHLIHHGEANSQLAASLISTFAGFSGALLIALKGGSENTATATTGPSGSTATVSDTPPTIPAAPSTAIAGQSTPAREPVKQ